MSLLNFNELQWRAMTAAINQIVPAPRFLQDMIFKTRNTNASDHVDVEVEIGGKKIIPFVSPVEGGITVSKLGREVRSIRTPRLRPKKPFSAVELFATRGVGQPFYGSGADISAYRKKKVGQELQDLRNRIDVTIEWMCSQALTGTLTVSQDNLAFTVDYQIPAANKTSPSVAWDAGSGTIDIIGNLEDYNDLIVNALGIGADLVIMGKNAWAALRNDSTVLEMVDKRHLDAGAIVLDTNSMRKGNLNGLELYRYGMKYTNSSDVATNFVADDYIIMVARGARFSIEFGQILDLDAEAQVVSEYFAKSWVTKDPSGLWILAESRPLPVPWQPEAVVYAKVTNLG